MQTRKRMPVSCRIIAVLVGLAPIPAFAADEVWGFKGTLSSYVSGPSYVDFADVPVGNIVRGQVLFDDSTLDGDGSATSGSYPYTSLALALEGDTELHLGVTASGAIGIKNDDPLGGGLFRDGVLLDVGSFLLVPSLTLNVALFDFGLYEDSATPAVLASDALPSPPPALAGFTTQKLLHVIGYVGGDVTDFDVAITEFGPVGTPDLPLIPDSVTVNPDGSVTWTFSTAGVSLCVSGCWVDPPVATGFTYAMTNGALFTSINEFPAGFGSAMEVSVGGSSIGTFGPGDSVAFAGGGVSSFTISGLAPPASTSSAAGFPLDLVFDSAGATFTMTSTPITPAPLLGWPALSLLVLVLTGTGAVVARRRIS